MSSVPCCYTSLVACNIGLQSIPQQIVGQPIQWKSFIANISLINFSFCCPLDVRSFVAYSLKRIMLFSLPFLFILQLLLHPASAQGSTSDVVSPPLRDSSLLPFTIPAHPANNLTHSLPLHLPPANTTANPNPLSITCRTHSTSTRYPLKMPGCASIIFDLLGRETPDAITPQHFRPSTPPWRHVDGSDTCEMTLTTLQPDAEDIFSVALVLQSAAQIAFYCYQSGMPSMTLGGTAVVGPKGVFELDVYGPALPDGVTGKN